MRPREIALRLDAFQVRAVRAGDARLVRLPVRPQPAFIDGLWHVLYPWGEGGHGIYETEEELLREFTRVVRRHCPCGVAGDLLWVRETWADGADGATVYRADDEAAAPPGGGWRPSGHMPRARSRFALRVTDIRIERVQAATVDDILAEGVRVPTNRDGDALVEITGNDAPLDFLPTAGPRTAEVHLRAQFASRYARRHGRESWDTNELTWVVAFAREGAGGSVDARAP